MEEFKIYDKKAYSHGFESIYSLQNVDLRTVRKVVSEKEQMLPIKKHEPWQIDLFTQNMAFYLDEPISVLELSLQAERRLVENGVMQIHHLVAVKNQLSQIKGLGLGHFDEIDQKLAHYMASKQNLGLDFLSLLRALLGLIEGKKLCFLLEPFGLLDYFSLAPSDRMLVKNQNKKQEAFEEAKAFVKEAIRMPYLQAAMQKINATFVIPWMYRKGGFAKTNEIKERLQSLSAAPFAQVLHFLENIFFDGKFPFADFLFLVEEELFAADLLCQKMFTEVTSTALSYFKKRGSSFLLLDLIHYVCQEVGKKWFAVDAALVEQIFRTSVHFIVKRTEENQSTIFLR